MDGIKYEFSGKLIIIPCGWVFVELPQALSKKIREQFNHLEKGWANLKVTAKVGNSEWQTSMTFLTEESTYTMPIKATIRKKENIVLNESTKIVITI